MDADTHVLVIGAASLDIKGRAAQELARGTSIPGQIRVNPGGVARNIAENLARLEVNTVLLSVVGDDDAGTRILGQAAGSGIDISNVLVAEGQQSGRYIALLNPDGSLASAVDDLSIMAKLTPSELDAQRSLFEAASMAAVDANIPSETLAMVVRLCKEYGVPLCGDPSSALLADRLRPHLGSLHMISPNARGAGIIRYSDRAE
jgi:pseudouridine kinase